MPKDNVQPHKPQMTTWRMRIARWMAKNTGTHSEYAILAAFSLQQWLSKCTRMLRYKYTACLVFISIPMC